MDELGKLISSLSKAEKRYFKLFTSLQSGEKSYLKLFEAVEKLGGFDEEKIKKMFEREDFVKRLPAVKNYLYGLILKSLRVQNSGASAESQVREMLDDASILHEKRLYKQCNKILEKAKEFAKQNELFPQLILISTMMERVMMETTGPDKLEDALEPALEEELIFLQLQKNLTEYRHLYNRVVLLNRRLKEARTEEELKQFQEIIDHPLLKSVDQALCFDSRNYFYQCHLIYNHAKGDNEACYSLAKKQMELIEGSMEKMKEKSKLYLASLNNVLLCQIHLHRYDQFDETLQKLKTFPLKSLSLEVSRFVNACVFEMVRYLDTGDFEKSVQLREEIKKGLEKFKEKLNPLEEITLLYNLFYSYFGTGEYHSALLVINRLLNDYQKDLRYDIQSAVKVVNLILHYELGNNMLIEYSAVSTYRFLSKSKRLYQIENIMLNYIRKKMAHTSTKKEQLASFKELREELSKLEQHPFEKKGFEYFDYISWLDSKIEGRSFSEIIQEKFRSQNQLATEN
jgi:hypothetical protein